MDFWNFSYIIYTTSLPNYSNRLSRNARFGAVCKAGKNNKVYCSLPSSTFFTQVKYNKRSGTVSVPAFCCVHPVTPETWSCISFLSEAEATRIHDCGESPRKEYCKSNSYLTLSKRRDAQHSPIG